jgi:hypothetical protein
MSITLPLYLQSLGCCTLDATLVDAPAVLVLVCCALCECVHFCVSCAVQGLYPGNKPCCADAIAVARLQLLCCMYDTLCRRSLSCAALDFDFEVLNSWYAVGGVSWSVLGPQPARPACMLHYSDTGVFEWVCMGQASHIQAG